jgi:hypothetical protein
MLPVDILSPQEEREPIYDPSLELQTPPPPPPQVLQPRAPAQP